jgi:O-antigen/teichoic acid export membrane protein
MSVTRKFSHGVAWMAIGNWTEQAVNFAVFVTLARLLGAKDYGLLAMASVFIVLSESLVRESLSEYLIAAKAPTREDFNATFWLLVALGCLLALALIGCSGIAARIYGEPEVRPIIMALSPSVVIVALNAVPVAILRRDLNFRVLSLRAIAGVVIGGVVGITMALKGFGVWSFVAQWLTLISTNAVMAWTAVEWRPGFATTRAHVREAALFGGQVLGLRAGELAATQTPLLVIGATLGPEATGLYSVAWRLVETLSFLIVTPLRMASQSAFAALSREGSGAGELLLDISRLTGTVALPFFAGLGVLAAPILVLVFGPNWLGAAAVLSALSLMGVYLCFTRVQMSFCLASGKAGAITILAWAVVALGALLSWLASPFGLVPAALGLIVAHFVLWPVYFRIVTRISGHPIADFLTIHIKPLIGAAIMGGVVAVVARWVDGPRAVYILSICVPIGLLVYLTFAWFTMRDRFHLLLTYVRGQPESAVPAEAAKI